MPDYPPAILQAAAEVMLRQYEDEHDVSHLAWQDFTGDARKILDAAAPLLTEAYQDLLGAIWLYIPWRYVTKQLTTPQKELFADAVDRDVMRSQAEDGEEPRPVAERWWRNDA